MHINQWDCFICIDNRSRQMPFFRSCQSGESAGQRPKKSFFCGIWFLYYIKQIDSMLPWVCSVIDHRRHQNVVRTSVTHSAIASHATSLFLPHFDFICNLLLNRWQHGIYLLKCYIESEQMSYCTYQHRLGRPRFAKYRFSNLYILHFCCFVPYLGSNLITALSFIYEKCWRIRRDKLHN